MLPLAQNNTSATRKYCTQSKCKTILPADGPKTCEKCRSISKLSKQKKRKREKADEGENHSPPRAPAPKDNDTDNSDTELKRKVSRISFEFLKEILPAIHPGNGPGYL